MQRKERKRREVKNEGCGTEQNRADKTVPSSFGWDGENLTKEGRKGEERLIQERRMQSLLF